MQKSEAPLCTEGGRSSAAQQFQNAFNRFNKSGKTNIFVCKTLGFTATLPPELAKLP